MEEEMLSIVSNGGMKVTAEASDSNSGSYQFSESERLDHSSDISPEKIKGVVSLQNGSWGAQIYINHQRIWLGTFKSKREAAMAYDSAAIKLRNGDCHRNFPWTNITVQEPEFQSLHSAETILTMIKDRSYPSKFADYLQNCLSGKTDEWFSLVKLQDQQGGFLCRLLFEKELTPSDVGKLNRLVIPKKYAIKHFPPASETAESNRDDNGIVDGLELTFYDRLMKVWKFRYCYWMSSQSFVFTRGWNRFVKEKGLKAKDHVAFYTFKCDQGGEMETETLCMIDVRYDRCKSSGGSVGVNHCELWPNLGQNADCGEDEELQDEQLIEIETTKSKEKSGFRLFGVQIG